MPSMVTAIGFAQHTSWSNCCVSLYPYLPLRLVLVDETVWYLILEQINEPELDLLSRIFSSKNLDKRVDLQNAIYGLGLIAVLRWI